MVLLVFKRMLLINTVHTTVIYRYSLLYIWYVLLLHDVEILIDNFISKRINKKNDFGFSNFKFILPLDTVVT